MDSPPEKHYSDTKRPETFDAAADSEDLSRRPKGTLKRYAFLVCYRGKHMADMDSRW